MGIKITNLKTGEEQQLPDNLFWQNEFEWTKVRSSNARSITGALIVVQSIAKGGRPITIGAKDNSNWTPRHIVERLFSWAEQVGVTLRVDIESASGNRSMTAVFNHTVSPVEAKPIDEYEAPMPDDDFNLTLNLTEVINP